MIQQTGFMNHILFAMNKTNLVYLQLIHIYFTKYSKPLDILHTFKVIKVTIALWNMLFMNLNNKYYLSLHAVVVHLHVKIFHTKYNINKIYLQKLNFNGIV
jgi:hypothetical protein